MKKLFLFIILIFVCSFSMYAKASIESSMLQSSESTVNNHSFFPIEIITNHSTTPRDAFTAGAIPKTDLDIILQAAIRSPSAGNRQPWHFTVVQNPELARKILGEIADGNVLIIVSAEGDGKTNYMQIIDCSLSLQSINLTARALGYGARIYIGPIDNLNRNLKSDLSLPVSHSAIAMIRVGLLAADAISGASSRNTSDSMVTFK